MASGDEGVLAASVVMVVSPKPGAVEPLMRYRNALNHSIREMVEDNTYSIPKARKLRYDELRRSFNLPLSIAANCYRGALTIAKPWLTVGPKGCWELPVLRDRGKIIF